jgi:hypothetical protein
MIVTTTALANRASWVPFINFAIFANGCYWDWPSAAGLGQERSDSCSKSQPSEWLLYFRKRPNHRATMRITRPRLSAMARD